MKIARISLRSVRDGDVFDISRWPPYKDAYAQMDYALRQNGWLAEFYNKPGTWCRIAEAEGKTVGFALLLMGGAKDAELRIAIHPEKTGQGFGRMVMMSVMESGFCEPDLETIHLVVRKNNFPAIRLYEGLGFTNRGECTLFIEHLPVEFFKMDIHRREFQVLRDKGVNQ
jgi:ribosomal protein S18 acetylase RimI-like enzyme